MKLEQREEDASQGEAPQRPSSASAIQENAAGERAFSLALSEAFNSLNSAAPLWLLRQQAWNQFQKQGLPAKGSEAFQYMRLSGLFANSYVINGEPSSGASAAVAALLQAHVLPECRESYLVFVQGRFCPELSRLEGLPSKVIISPLEAVARSFSLSISNQQQQTLLHECDPFYLINGALHSSAAFLYIPPKTILERPIQVIDIVDSTDAYARALVTLPRLQIAFGAYCEATVILNELRLGCGAASCHNIAVEMALEEGVRVNYVQVAQGLGDNIWLFDGLRASLKRHSTLITTAVTEGSSCVRRDYRVTLQGEGGDVQLNGIWMLSGRQEAHNYVIVDHQAPRCTSMQLFKGVLNETSRSSFEGKILVRHVAQKTEAFQLNNNLILSKYAQAYAKPNLEIFTDDVKASHGATTGQIDPQQLFYLKTRGFTDAEAKALLVYGFCEEVMKCIALPSLHAQLEDKLRLAAKKIHC